MMPDEALVHDFATELLRTSRVSDATYARALKEFGERGVIALTGTIGYFVAVCYVMNVAGTPPPPSDVAPLKPLSSPAARQ
jgi:4-carboxymuconolactone decarboxylase